MRLLANLVAIQRPLTVAYNHGYLRGDAWSSRDRWANRLVSRLVMARHGPIVMTAPAGPVGAMMPPAPNIATRHLGPFRMSQAIANDQTSTVKQLRRCICTGLSKTLGLTAEDAGPHISRPQNALIFSELGVSIGPKPGCCALRRYHQRIGNGEVNPAQAGPINQRGPALGSLSTPITDRTSGRRSRREPPRSKKAKEAALACNRGGNSNPLWDQAPCSMPSA